MGVQELVRATVRCGSDVHSSGRRFGRRQRESFRWHVHPTRRREGIIKTDGVFLRFRFRLSKGPLMTGIPDIGPR